MSSHATRWQIIFCSLCHEALTPNQQRKVKGHIICNDCLEDNFPISEPTD